MAMRTVNMNIDVTFDDAVTDAESVSNALDTLLETAMSTPDILDEYGEVSVGPFLLGPEEENEDDGVPDYDEERDGAAWFGFRRFSDGRILNCIGFDRDGNRVEYWE
jgi:hypothetical protein